MTTLPAALSVGIVGIGAMGLPIALRLRDLGHAVVVRDIDPAREALAAAAGCRVAPTPAACAAGVQLLIVCVVDDRQLHAVLAGPDGAAAGLAPGSAVLLCPTVAPQAVEAAAALLAARGVQALDAPMSGGPARARDGSMSLMVACPEDSFARWQPLLQALAARLFHVGTRPGDGARTKLVNNLLAAVNLAAAAEAMALAEGLGLDPAATLAVIEQSSGQSWVGCDRIRRALAGDTTVQARIALLAKDSRLALDAAAAAAQPVPVGAAAAAQFARALAEGRGDADDASLWHRRPAAVPPAAAGPAQSAP